VILIMTTNAGAADMAREPIGFGRLKREGEDEEAINRMFAPEFRNRLDAVIPFDNLPPEVVAMVVDKFVLQLEAQLADRNITIELSEDANKWIADRGYDPQMGARPLSRIIQEFIKKPLADEVLFGKLKNGGTVKVIVEKPKEGEPHLGFEFIEPEPRPAAPKKPRKKASKPKKSGPSGKGGSGGGPVVPKIPLASD
jgi:ATP-dependent Clp protease ATP-binding subunit ClpA